MKIRNDENLQRLAEVAGVAPETMSKRIASNLLKFDDTIDDCNNWQNEIADFIPDDTPICDVAKMLDKCGIKRRTMGTLSAFFHCVLIGDGNCPVCGGDLDVEEIGHYLNDGDSYTERTWVVDEYVHVCYKCGFTKKSKYEEF